MVSGTTDAREEVLEVEGDLNGVYEIEEVAWNWTKCEGVVVQRETVGFRVVALVNNFC